MDLIRNGYAVNVGVLRNGEIDFVATKSRNAVVLYIQVAYALTDEAAAEKEYGAFRALKSEGEKILVTLDEVKNPVREGVRHLRARELADYLDKSS